MSDVVYTDDLREQLSSSGVVSQRLAALKVSSVPVRSIRLCPYLTVSARPSDSRERGPRPRGTPALTI
jgi:hypothetical protein